MIDEREQRLFDLAREYLNYVSLMQRTDLRDEDRQYLSSQRTIVHDELIALTGLARPFNMAEYCADLLGGRRRAIFTSEQPEADPDHITCPHCAGALPLDDKRPGDRKICPRCNNWVLLARFTSGVWYGVKVQGPRVKGG